MIKLDYPLFIPLVIVVAIVFYKVYLKYKFFKTEKTRFIFLHFTNFIFSVCSVLSFYILSKMFTDSFNISENYTILQIVFVAVISVIFTPFLWSLRIKKYLK